MRFWLMTLLLILGPYTVGAAEVVLQSSTFDIDSWTDVTVPETHYGVLTGFPHTFQFLVKKPTTISLSLATPVKDERTALLLVKEKDRGVEEILRLSDKSNTELFYDKKLGIKIAGYQETLELTSGIYRLEVSSPSNSSRYQLKVGDKINQSYFAKIGEVFTARNLWGSWFGGFTSPIVYWPLLIILVGYLTWRKIKQYYA